MKPVKTTPNPTGADVTYPWLQSGGDDFIESVIAVIDSDVKAAGYRLVRVQLEGIRTVQLRLMVDHIGHETGSFLTGAFSTVSAAGLSGLSRRLSPLLEVSGLFRRPWRLELSSPGVARYLSARQDFIRAVGGQLCCHFRRPAGLAAPESHLTGTLAAIFTDGHLDSHALTLHINDSRRRLRLIDLEAVNLVYKAAASRSPGHRSGRPPASP